MIEALNEERYDHLRRHYGESGPVDEERFLAAFIRDPYEAETWLYCRGGDIDPDELAKAKAEDARYRKFLQTHKLKSARPYHEDKPTVKRKPKPSTQAKKKK